MKKLLFVLAIGAFAAACNDNAGTTESTIDSNSVIAPDTMSITPDTTLITPSTDTTVAQ